jgi:hypothetical protein
VVVVVARPDTGQEVDGLRFLVVTGTQELPAGWAGGGDEALQLQGGEHVGRIRNKALEILLTHHLIAGGNHDGADLDVENLATGIDRPRTIYRPGRTGTFAGGKDRLAGFFADLGLAADALTAAIDTGRHVNDRLFRHRLGEMDIGGTAVVEAGIEFIGSAYRAGGGTGPAPGALLPVDIGLFTADLDLEVADIALNRLDFGVGEKVILG